MSTATAAQGTHIAPTNLQVAIVDDQGQLNLTWDAPTVTLVAPETSRAPVIRYEIQYVQRDASTQDSDNVDDDLAALVALDDGAAILVPTPPTNRNYSHTGLPGRQKVRLPCPRCQFGWRWRIFNPNGWYRRTRGAPDAPTLTATAVSASEILLEWNVPADNGTPILGFVIQQWDPTVNTDADTDLEGAWGGDVKQPS